MENIKQAQGNQTQVENDQQNLSESSRGYSADADSNTIRGASVQQDQDTLSSATDYYNGEDESMSM